MKNMITIFLTVCIVSISADNSCGSYGHCDNTTKMQLQKALIKIKLLQKTQQQLAIKNQQLCNTVVALKKQNSMLQHQSTKLIRKNKKLQAQVIALSNEIQPYAQKYDILSNKYEKACQERDVYASKFSKACLEKDKISASYQEACQERDAYASKFNKVCSERDKISASYEEVCQNLDKLSAKYQSVCDKRDFFKKQYDLECQDKGIVHAKYTKLQEQNAILCNEKIALESEVNKWKKACANYESTSSCAAPSSSNYTVKFVTHRKMRKHVRRIMGSLGESDLSVENKKVVAHGIEFTVTSQLSSHEVFQTLAKSFAKKGIKIHLAGMIGKEITTRISPWSMY